MNFVCCEAQERAFKEVLILALSGIEARITPTKSRTDEAVIKKHKDDLPADRWVHVSFRVKGKDELTRIFDAGDRLWAMGVYFDTGGCKGRRDWELDWSLKMGKKEAT